MVPMVVEVNKETIDQNKVITNTKASNFHPVNHLDSKVQIDIEGKDKTKETTKEVINS